MMTMLKKKKKKERSKEAMKEHRVDISRGPREAAPTSISPWRYHFAVEYNDFIIGNLGTFSWTRS
jgi:hypothetical protein